MKRDKRYYIKFSYIKGEQEIKCTTETDGVSMACALFVVEQIIPVEDCKEICVKEISLDDA